MKTIKCKFCGIKSQPYQLLHSQRFLCDTWQGTAAWYQSIPCKIIARLQKRIQRMKTAGDEIVLQFYPDRTSDMNPEQIAALKEWNKAKEAKP